MGRVVSLSDRMGVSQEQLFGVMATFTGVTGTASEVATQFRGVLQALDNPTASMAELFNRLGVASGRAMIEQFGLAETLRMIVDTAEASGIPLADFIGQVEGQTLAASGAARMYDELVRKTGDMVAAAGATEAAFKAQTQGINAFGFAMQQMRTVAQIAMEATGDVIGDVMGRRIGPVIQTAVGSIRGFRDFMMNLPAPVRDAAVGIAAFAAALGPALIVIGKLIKLAPLVAGAWAFMTGPIGLTIGTIAALAGGVAAAKTEIERMTAAGEIAAESTERSFLRILGHAPAFAAFSGILGRFWDHFIEPGRQAESVAEDLENLSGVFAPMRSTSGTGSAAAAGADARVREAQREAERVAGAYMDTLRRLMGGGGGGGITAAAGLQGATPAAFGDVAAPALPEMQLAGLPLGRVFGEMAKLREQLSAEKAAIVQIVDDIGASLRDGLNGALEGLAEGFGNLAAGTGSLGDIGRNLLGTFAGLMQKLGGMMIAFGMAGIKFQSAGGFLSFLTNPVAAVAAGGLLIAAGAAIKGLLGRASKGGAGGGAAAGVTSIGVNANAASTVGSRALAPAPATQGTGTQQVEVALVGMTLPSGDVRFSQYQGLRRMNRQGVSMS
jgi:hypothetical protein